MLQGDKLELMKYSLFQLTNYLRPEDKMSIVTYSSTAKVLVPPTAGSEKDFIKNLQTLKQATPSQTLQQVQRITHE